VTNRGGPATFRAQIEVLSKHRFPGARDGMTEPGFWRRTSSPDSDILRDHQDSLVLGGVEFNRDIAKVSLYYAGGYTTPNSVWCEWPSLSSPPLDKPTLLLRVTVSSIPESDPWVGHLRLSPDGLEEWDP
jgi:hypothetical protein